eukprot:scaffold154880_cov40-Prasinocladus_malaysianus.AAC.1
MAPRPSCPPAPLASKDRQCRLAGRSKAEWLHQRPRMPGPGRPGSTQAQRPNQNAPPEPEPAPDCQQFAAAISVPPTRRCRPRAYAHLETRPEIQPRK